MAKPLEKLAQDKQGTFISLSYTFRPGFVFDGLSPDLVLSTADRTLFYVHYEHVLSASSNSFGLFLPPSLCSTGDAPFPAGRIPEHADVLNIILLTIYNMSAVPFFPSFETISSALDAFSRYGFEPKQYACVGQPLYNLILGCEGAQPIDTYALAGAHDLSDVAVAASVHLLSFPLSTLSDELAQRMGAVYLKKLFFRHFGMMNALKRVLMKPPGMHSDTADCSLAQRKCLTRAWALATAHIVWDAGPSKWATVRLDWPEWTHMRDAGQISPRTCCRPPSHHLRGR